LIETERDSALKLFPSPHGVLEAGDVIRAICGCLESLKWSRELRSSQRQAMH